MEMEGLNLLELIPLGESLPAIFWRVAALAT